MARSSVKPRDRTCAKSYLFFCFDRNIGKKVAKNMSKTSKFKYSQNLLNNATDALKTASNKEIQKTVEATGDFIVIKSLIELQKARNNSETNEE